MKRILFAAIALAVSSGAMAIDFEVKLDCDELSVQGACATLKSELESQAEKDLPDTTLDDYTVGVGNAVAMAGSDNSDYADKFNLFMFKYSPIGVGISGSGDAGEANNLDGIGFQGVMQVGLNLDMLPIDKIGPVELKKLDIFGSFFSTKLNESNDEEGTETEAEVSAFGVHARYHLVEGVDLLPGYLAEWGGLFVHAGFRQSKMKLNMTQDIDDTDISEGGVTAKFTNTSAEFEMDSSVTSIPIEFSTYFRFLYVFTLYGGAGYTLNTGSTDINFTASGDIYEGSNDVGDVDLDDKNDGTPKSTARYFAGLQFNLPYFRLYTHVNKAIGENVASAHVGVKILY